MMKPNKPLLTSPQPTQPPQPVEVTCSASEPGSYMESQYLSKACLERPSSCPGLRSPGAQPTRDPKKVPYPPCPAVCTAVRFPPESVTGRLRGCPQETYGTDGICTAQLI